MFGLGTWRLFLAFLVAISHLWAGMIHGPAAYAVWGFFVLSGYLMTFVLTTKYGTDPEGLREYAWNRFLRIYPLYFIALVLGLLTIGVLNWGGFDPSKLNPQFRFPSGAGNWFANLSLAFFLPQTGLAVPVSGALAVEVGAYVLMPLFARSRSAALLAALVAFAANQQLGFGMESFGQRYAGFATGLFPFAIGSLCCHYREELRSIATPALSVGAWCLFSLWWLVNPPWPWTGGLPLSVLLSAWVTISLAGVKGNQVDRWAGDFSYPVYLLHTTIAAWFLPLFGYERPFRFFAMAFAVTALVSWVLIVAVDRRVQRLKLPGRLVRKPADVIAMPAIAA